VEVTDRRVAIPLRATDGFYLALRWNDSGASSVELRPVALDDAFLVETNDPALAAAWLDDVARTAVLASRVAPPPGREPAEVGPLVRDTSWRYSVTPDAVIAERETAEPSVARLERVIAAVRALADAPIRIAAQLARIAPALGGNAANRADLGGQPVLRVARGAQTIAIYLMRRLAVGEPGRLRTLVSAHRHVSDGSTISLLADRIPSAAVPPANDTRGKAMRINARAEELLDAMAPTSALVRAHDVEIAFDGLMLDVRRLSAAIDLAAIWAVDGALESGPYR
jgi:hypothetical protein